MNRSVRTRLAGLAAAMLVTLSMVDGIAVYAYAPAANTSVAAATALGLVPVH